MIFTWFWIVSDLEYRVGFAELILLFYLIQRFNPYWRFTPAMFYDQVYLWDFIVASIVLPRIKVLFSLKKGDRESIPESNAGFVEERPIGEIIEDSFQRNVVAKQIASLISETKNRKSFAIGILGEYGSGKTSFINLIKLNLEGSAQMIDFNPWSAENTPNIQKDFFDLMANHLSKTDPKLSHLILSYSRKLREVDTWAEKIYKRIGFLSNLFYTDGYNDDHKTIDEILKKSSKKIVIAIDDLDRLYSTEIIEVLKLIRNTASFSNVVFIVAYEKGYVQEAIKSLNIKATTSYLDKIMQLEIPLPKREEDDLLNLLRKYLEKILIPADLTTLEKRVIRYGFKNLFDLSYKTVFRHSRDVIKFINSFVIPYRLLGEEVLFENLFVLELLKFRFPIVYDLLYNNSEKFIRIVPVRASHREKFELLLVKDGDRERPAALDFLDGDYSNEDKVLIGGLLSNLFSSFTENDTKNSIINPLFFERYFRFRLGNEISEREFQIAIKTGLEKVKEYIDNCLEKKLHVQILTRLFQEKSTARDEFELIISGIFYLGPKYLEYKGYRSFDNQSLIDMIWDYEGLVTKKFYKDIPTAYQQFLKGLFENAPSPYNFHNQLIYDVKMGNQKIGLENDELVSFQLRYLIDYIDRYGFTKDGLWLMWGIREHYNTPGPEPGKIYKHWRFELSIVEYLRKALQEKDPTQFLSDSIKTEMREKGIACIHPEILAIFENEDDLRKVAETNSFIAEDVRLEYLDFFDRCRLEDFDEYIVYDFKTILKPKRSGESEDES
ncbi:P-loop NTPase fold protein [Pedobacter nutrimenti]|uniref:KAP family P-loop NTPase fold protein n=1 Tax=Pedobacter nutrimenti TaxID=1241337 RepID=UPI002931EC94|nr:P-loop NTPase fold protein [Pedobacter nutrimenti]